jgi:hypothetical protein
VSPRDLCVARRWKKENGIFVIMKKSITHPKCPEVDGCVRANLQMQLIKLVPIKNGTETEVTHINLLEFGGWVPSQIVQIASRKIPTTFAKNIVAACKVLSKS